MGWPSCNLYVGLIPNRLYMCPSDPTTVYGINRLRFRKVLIADGVNLWPIYTKIFRLTQLQIPLFSNRFRSQRHGAMVKKRGGCSGYLQEGFPRRFSALTWKTTIPTPQVTGSARFRRCTRIELYMLQSTQPDVKKQFSQLFIITINNTHTGKPYPVRITRQLTCFRCRTAFFQ